MLSFSITEEIRRVLDQIADAESEGNSREILRRIRDSFLNGGWDGYRNIEAVRSVITAIELLCSAEQVTPDNVKACSIAMRNAGLRPIDVPIFSFEDEDQSTDGTEDQEVFD